jgi:hypothetical protein
MQSWIRVILGSNQHWEKDNGNDSGWENHDGWDRGKIGRLV